MSLKVKMVEKEKVWKWKVWKLTKKFESEKWKVWKFESEKV